MDYFRRSKSLGCTDWKPPDLISLPLSVLEAAVGELGINDETAVLFKV